MAGDGVIGKLRTAWVLLLLALVAGPAFALGLGQIEVKSQRDQPLLAEIPIISSDPAELENLQARLASPETFARIGLEPPQGVVSDLQFTVALDAQGRPVIRVTSAVPVPASPRAAEAAASTRCWSTAAPLPAVVRPAVVRAARRAAPPASAPQPTARARLAWRRPAWLRPEFPARVRSCSAARPSAPGSVAGRARTRCAAHPAAPNIHAPGGLRPSRLR